MSYINIKELAEQTGQSVRTLERKVAFFKEKHLALYLRHTSRDELGKGVKYEEKFLVPYFNESKNFKGYKSKQDSYNQKDDNLTTGVELDVVAKYQRLQEEVEVIELTKEQKEVLSLLKSQDDKDRFQIVVLICSKYANSATNIEDVLKEDGISYVGFDKWLKKYKYLQPIYKVAKKQHKKYIRKNRIELAEESLTLLSGKATTKNIKLKQVIDKDGVIHTLQEVETREHLPSLSAVQYVLNNFVSKHYKDKQPIKLEQFKTNQEEGEEIIAQMTLDEQIEAMELYKQELINQKKIGNND